MMLARFCRGGKGISSSLVPFGSYISPLSLTTSTIEIKRRTITNSSIQQPQDLANALKPREVVDLLDKYIIGQREAKRAVAIALRNRWRRHQLPPDLKNEVSYKL